ncbi:Fanconi anemia core complex-associated protein 24-like isoform X2 [Ischnura elegans]|uniref:Fanconi anemia core complex-associated protein 24-like isoform X2 n=1 Tax=Ischnura elegans TaxID=197161 RepID=UPI001ED8B6F4|nr:Fanconi anemia core complex-associated protein 24-like isoform X2 [Ischnura elegans]
MTSSKTLSKRVDVPGGYIFMHEKWQGSQLAQEVHKKTKGCCYEDLGIVDFFPSNFCPVVYLSEADVLCSESCKDKVKYLAKEYPKCRGVVVIMQSPSSLEAFKEMQKMAVIHYSLTVIPITSLLMLPEILIRIETTSPGNPFKCKKKKLEAHSEREQQIALLCNIPGIRETNSMKLLKVFGTIVAISNASYSQLAAAVGNSVAKSVLDFFHGKGEWK